MKYRLFKTFLALPLAAAFLWTGAARAADDSAQLFAKIDSILAELSEITGMEVKHSVPSATITRPELKKFLDDRIRETVKPEEIRAEELTLKKFGLVPQDFDLRKTTIDLLTEQAAAFYDMKKKKLFILDEAGSAEMQETVLVHELAHALADQHFDLEKFIKGGGKNDDSALARMGVMEGQASWLMAEWMARRMGTSLAKSPAIARRMAALTKEATGQFPVFEGAPLYMQITLTFPYTEGMMFQHAVFERMGKESFKEVFRNPPVSTQQIIHPELYFERRMPTTPELPRLPETRGLKKLSEGAVGQLDHAVLIEQYVGKEEAGRIAPKWRGGQFRLYDRKGNGPTLLTYASDWESEEAARSYFEMYSRIQAGKWKSRTVERETANEVVGVGDDGHFVVRLVGTQVAVLEGLSRPAPATK